MTTQVAAEADEAAAAVAPGVITANALPNVYAMSEDEAEPL